MICMLFQMKVKDGNVIQHPTNVHFDNLSTSFTPKTKSTNYNDYFYYVAMLKTSSVLTDVLTEIKVTGIKTQLNVSIFCNFQFTVLPLTTNIYAKEIFDVRLYNNVIKAQETKINDLESELTAIKLNYDPVYFYGPLSHNNGHKALFKQTAQVKFSGSDFEFVPPNFWYLRFKKSGIYHVCYIDGVKTDRSTYIKVKFTSTGLDVVGGGDEIVYPIKDTKSTWIKIYESFTVPVNKDATMNISIDRLGFLDGTSNSRIMISKVAGYPIDVI